MDRVSHFGLFCDEPRDQFGQDVVGRETVRDVFIHEGARSIAFAVIPGPRISLDVLERLHNPR